MVFSSGSLSRLRHTSFIKIKTFGISVQKNDLCFNNKAEIVKTSHIKLTETLLYNSFYKIRLSEHKILLRLWFNKSREGHRYLYFKKYWRAKYTRWFILLLRCLSQALRVIILSVLRIVRISKYSYLSMYL